VHRETGGKPARLYGLTQEGEELFPKAYAAVLGELVGEIARATGRKGAVSTLEAVGRRVAAERTKALDDARARPAERVAAAAAALRELGADLDVQRVKGGWRLQGYGCPLSAVTAPHPEVCALAQAIVADVSGCTVRECCDRSVDRPRCAFAVRATSG
jgi:predicted ArsR family transcriptional regulator